MEEGPGREHAQRPTVGIKHWLALVLALSLIFICCASWYYGLDSHREREEAYNSLRNIGRLKLGQVISWRRDLLVAARIYASGISSNRAKRAFAGGSEPAFWKQLRSRLSLIASEAGIDNLMIENRSGELLYAQAGGPAAVESGTRALAQEALRRHAAVLGDFSGASAKDIRIEAAAPILSDEGEEIGVLIVRHDPAARLFPILESWPSAVRSAETVLVRKAGDSISIVTPPRFQQDKALRLSYPLTETKRIGVAALLHGEGLIEGLNYRGHKVLADTAFVPDSDWMMIAMEDKAEILEPVVARGLAIALLCALLASLTAMGAGLLFQSRRKNAYKRLFDAELERGNALSLFRTTLYSIGDGVITTDIEGRVRHINRVAEELTGWCEEDARGRELTEVFRIIGEENRRGIEDPVRRVLREGTVVELANHTILIARDGVERPIADSGAPIRSSDGSIIGCVLVFRDQSKQRSHDMALQSSLAQKDVLLHEVHHRVKNNLQLISSLINLQSDQIIDERYRAVFLVCQNRIKAIADLHELLYSSHDFISIDFPSYLRRLIAGLVGAYGRMDGSVVLREELDCLSLDLDTAISCGLIMNELVTNALKHAFPEGRPGCVTISCHQDPSSGTITLAVADDGVGFPSDYEPETSRSLGMKLVDVLTKQIKGELVMETGTGVKSLITFCGSKGALR
jgi:PAS domain S-box-containing protein